MLGRRKNGRKTRIGTQISTFTVSLMLGPLTTLAMKSDTSAAVRGCFLVQLVEFKKRAAAPAPPVLQPSSTSDREGRVVFSKLHTRQDTSTIIVLVVGYILVLSYVH